jgi:translocation protein SEC62
VYSFEKSPSGQGIYRAALVVAFAAFLYWAYSQPTEFDDLVKAQRQFMADLYEGNLLSDTAQVNRLKDLYISSIDRFWDGLGVLAG